MNNSNLIIFFILFFVSLLFTFLINKYIYPRIKKFVLSPHRPQKIHLHETSRIGGLSIYITTFFVSLILFISNKDTQNLLLLLLLTSTPAFFIGFIEDITQKIKPIFRLLGSLLSAFLFIFIFKVFIQSVGISIIDEILNYKIISVLFSVLCIVFLTQSFNIIDGLNGLSLITCISSLLTVGFIAHSLGDLSIFNSSMYLVFIMLGFLFYNFPFGKIFLGDGGAYLIGMIVSFMLILFINKTEIVSPFVVVQIIIFPTYELFRTIIRRFFIEKINISQPDLKHLHSLLYLYYFAKKSKSELNSNIFSSCNLITLQLFNCLFVVSFYEDEQFIKFGILGFIVIYELLYYSINQKLNSSY